LVLQILVDYAMMLQMLEAAKNASGHKRGIVAGTWPSTPKGRLDIKKGDRVLYRASPRQKRGVPALVTSVTEDGLYDLAFYRHERVTGVLEGRLLRFDLQVGDSVECAFGTGTLFSTNELKCTVDVGGTLHTIHHLAVVPCCEPHTNFNKNPTMDLMLRTCRTTLCFVDIFAGEPP